MKIDGKLFSLLADICAAGGNAGQGLDLFNGPGSYFLVARLL
jgi:hypothetical protein